MSGGGAHFGSGESGRQSKDRPSRCRETGALPQSGRFDGGLGSGRGARSAARSGPRPRSGEKGSAARTAPAQQISSSTRPPAVGGDESLDRQVHGVGKEPGPLRATGFGGGSSGLLP